jgi:NDP-sugar pyrophosphorylase family protein
MRDLTTELPKPMIEVRGKPFSSTSSRGCARLIEQFLIIVGYRAEVVRQFLGDGTRFGGRITYASAAVQDGTGKVVEAGARLRRRPLAFVLSYGDIIVEPSNYQRLVRLDNECEAIVSVKRNEDVVRGAVFVNERFELIDLRKSRRPVSRPVPWYNAGIYAFRPSIFEFTAASSVRLAVNLN